MSQMQDDSTFLFKHEIIKILKENNVTNDSLIESIIMFSRQVTYQKPLQYLILFI